MGQKSPQDFIKCQYTQGFRQKFTSHFKPLAIPIILEVKTQQNPSNFNQKIIFTLQVDMSPSHHGPVCDRVDQIALLISGLSITYLVCFAIKQALLRPFFNVDIVCEIQDEILTEIGHRRNGMLQN